MLEYKEFFIKCLLTINKNSNLSESMKKNLLYKSIRDP